MQPEKWAQIKEAVAGLDADFILEKSVLPAPRVGEVEILSFRGPLGKMKLEYTTQPVILDKKTVGSRRIGSTTHVDYVYAEDEFTHSFKAFKWDEEQADWVAIDTGGSFNFSSL